jgi:hypothetical protein
VGVTDPTINDNNTTTNDNNNNSNTQNENNTNTSELLHTPAGGRGSKESNEEKNWDGKREREGEVNNRSKPDLHEALGLYTQDKEGNYMWDMARAWNHDGVWRFFETLRETHGDPERERALLATRSKGGEGGGMVVGGLAATQRLLEETV